MAKIEDLEKRIAAQKQIVKYKPKPLPKRINKNVSLPVGMPYMPREMMIKMFQHMDPKTIIQTCTSSKYNEVCDDTFWRMKLKSDFDILSKRKTGVSDVYKRIARFYYDIEKDFDKNMERHLYTVQVTKKTAKLFMSAGKAKELFKGVELGQIHIIREPYNRYSVRFIRMGALAPGVLIDNDVPRKFILLGILKTIIPKKEV